jgi:tetratricopeptide (TPR) repeat protein
MTTRPGRNPVRVYIAAACMFVFTSAFMAAQPIKPQAAHELLLRGIEQSGRQEYSKAIASFEELIRSFPAHPAGYLNKAILLEVMSLDFEVPVSKEYLPLLERAESIAEGILKNDPNNSEAKYYLGMADSYIAYYKFRDGENWISGLTHGLSAYKRLKECLELNPRAFDAMTGMGTFRYWKSRKASMLTWTPFVDDERQAGIDQLRIAERSGTYTNQQASNSLIWIYIDAERYNDAVRTAQNVLRRFPKHRLFLWGLGSAAEKKSDWKLAREAYQRILQSIDNEVTERRYIEIQARAKVALMSFNRGDKAAAKRECTRVLMKGRVSTQGLSADGAERVKKRIAEMEKLKMQLL